MVLDAGCVAWLRRNISSAAGECDLDDAYGFEHELNFDRELVIQAVREERGAFRWEVDFLDNGMCKLLEDTLARELAADVALLSGEGRGVVAFHQGMKLREDARGRGFGSLLHRAECDLYSSWGVREIHLEAEEDGLTFWPRRGFEPADPAVLSRRYRVWAEENGVTGPPPARAGDYPPAFLKAQQWLSLVKVVSR